MSMFDNLVWFLFGIGFGVWLCNKFQITFSVKKKEDLVATKEKKDDKYY